MSQLRNSRCLYPEVLNQVGLASNGAGIHRQALSFLRVLANRYYAGQASEALRTASQDQYGPICCPLAVYSAALGADVNAPLGTVGCAHFDAELRLMDVSPELCCIFGKDRTNLLGCLFDELFRPQGAVVRDTLETDEHVDLIWFEFYLPGAIEGDRRRQVLSIWRRNRQDEIGSVSVYVGEYPVPETGSDRLLRTLHQLTGLLSAKEIAVELERAVARRTGTRGFVLMLLSLGQFPTFSTLFGPVNSELVIKEITNRLRETVGDRGLIGLIRPDEFAIILDAGGPVSGVELAHQIVASIRQPYVTGKEEVAINARAGLALFPEHGLSADQIGRAAETALSHAKSLNTQTVQAFNERIGRASDRRVELERSLRQAIKRGEFELEYQPRIDLRSMRVVAMEALMRWNHPQLGRIPPLDFIPIAEETGLIGDLGRWALHTACAFASEVAVNGVPVRVSVNVSAQQLTDMKIVEDIEFALGKAKLMPELLELELTESLLIEDSVRCADLLRRLKKIGVALSVDDFGTGYSSLAYLQLFPVDAIKLDKTFVNRGGEGTNNLRLVKALVDLVHALELKVVAEGVETAEILQFLHASGCDEIQGYLLARPLKAVDFRRFLRTYVPSLEKVARGQPVSLAAAA